MVTSIQLGNFFSSGGRAVLGGVGGSGLDTESLVKGLSDAKRLPAADLETRVKKNDKISSALGEFKTLLSKFKDAVSFLRNPPGVANQAQNAFLYTSSNVVSNDGSVAGNYLSVKTSPGVTPQTFTIGDIISVARAKQQSTANITFISPETSFDADDAFVTASATTNRFKAGTVTINGEAITLETGDSLNQVAAKFNAVKNDTGIAASVIKVSENNYRLVFTATQTGEDADFDLNDIAFDTVSDPGGVLNGFVFSQLTPASNAEFILNGVTIERQSNAVSDVVNGVTFNILQATPVDTVLTATVSADTEVAKNAIINFINAYNDIRVFAAKQLEVGDDGVFVEDAVLSSNTTFRNTVSNITNTLTQIVSGITSGDPNRLADVGVTFADLPKSEKNPLVRNILDLNEGTLTAKLAEDFDEFRRVFEFDFTSTNPNLRVFSRTNALAVSNFDLTITDTTPPTLPTATATYGGGQTATFTVSEITDNATGNVIGYTLKGQDNTVFAGLQLIYSSTGAGTATVTTTQGLADKVFNISDEVLKKDTGALDIELAAIKSSDTRLEDEIAKIDEQVERFRQQLLEKFGELERSIAKVNTLLQSIDAQNQARYNN